MHCALYLSEVVPPSLMPNNWPAFVLLFCKVPLNTDLGLSCGRLSVLAQ